MKILATIACGLHFFAVLLTSGVGLCVGNDGHADYEFGEEACCGEAVLAQESCCEECGGVPVERVAAAPDCGGCLDGLAPLASGVQIDLDSAVAAPVETGAVELVGLYAAEECSVAGGPATVTPLMSSPLRC